MDLGAAGLSGYFAAEQFFGLNCDNIPDAAQGANRDMIWSLKHAGLFGFWLCMLISWNLPFGPNKDSMRLHLGLVHESLGHNAMVFFCIGDEAGRQCVWLRGGWDARQHCTFLEILCGPALCRGSRFSINNGVFEFFRPTHYYKFLRSVSRMAV